MRKAGLVLMAAALVAVPLLGGGLIQAASPEKTKPVAVLAFSGYDELKADVAYVGKLSGNPGLADALEVLLKVFVLKNQSLEGLAKDRPWGVVVQLDEQKLAEGVKNPKDALLAYGFIPVSDLKALLKSLEPVIGQAKDAGDGVFELRGQPKAHQKPTFVKQSGEWAFLADRAERLATTPEAPDRLLGDLAEKYDLAFRVYLSNVPQEVRKQILGQIRRHAEADLQKRKPALSEEEYAVRKIFADRTLRSAEMGLTELEAVTGGWALDHKEGKTYLDLSLAAKAGTKTARSLASLGDAHSKFAGFLMPQATLKANWAGQSSPADTADALKVLDLVRKKALADIKRQPADKAEVAAELFNGAMDVLRATAAAGKADGGMVALLDPNAVTLAAGGFVAEGEKLDGTLKRLVDAVTKEHPEAAGLIEWDAGEHQGVKFHAASIPIPPEAKDRQKVVQAVGEALEVVVGVGKQSAYVAVGRKPKEVLKEVIDRSAAAAAEKVPPLRLSLDLGSLTKFVSIMGDKEEERQKAALAASLLEKAGEDDHVNLVAGPIPNGVRLRVEIEEGILKALGAMTTKRGQ